MLDDLYRLLRDEIDLLLRRKPSNTESQGRVSGVFRRTEGAKDVRRFERSGSTG